jgi:hypothetical protein
MWLNIHCVTTLVYQGEWLTHNVDLLSSVLIEVVCLCDRMILISSWVIAIVSKQIIEDDDATLMESST